MACRSSDVSDAVRLKNRRSMRWRSRPLLSSAAIVLPKRRRVGALGDGVDLGAVRVHRVQERRQVVLRLDAVERRQAVGRLPRLQQRILVVIGHGLEAGEMERTGIIVQTRWPASGQARCRVRRTRPSR